MTMQRRDNHSTEFGLWLRQQPEIDSRNGYRATNIDYWWGSYITNIWMYLEEKRYGWVPSNAQTASFMEIDSAARSKQNYRGFHLVVFENTCPDDGRIWLDGNHIDRADLIEFLQFLKPQNWYESYFCPSYIARIGFGKSNSSTTLGAQT